MAWLKRRSSLRACAFSPDGQLVCFGGYDNEAGVVRVATGDVMWTLKRAGPVWAVTWSPDGSQLVIAGMDKQMTIVDAAGVILYELRREWWIFSCDWSPDGRLAAGGMGGLLIIPDTQVDLGSVWCVKYSRSTLAVGCVGRVVLFGTSTVERERQGAVHSVDFSGDGSLVACGSETSVSLLDLQGQLLFECQTRAKVFACCIIDSALLVGCWGSLRISVVFEDSATYLPVSAPDDPGLDHPPGTAAVTCLDVSPDGTLVAFARTDGVLGLAPSPRVASRLVRPVSYALPGRTL